MYYGHVVSHTHWDREWYLTFQQFRIQLVDLIDDLIKILSRNREYRSFTLDGQTIVVEDYLEIRPQMRDKIKQLVKQKRLLIGPWYVQADEFLGSGEMLIHNLLIGHRIAKEFGYVYKVGYIPDLFGHNSQMPQIFTGFGIDSAFLHRGLSIKDTGETEFIWESPDGSRVLSCLLPFGYHNFLVYTEKPYPSLKHISTIEEAFEKLKDIKERFIPISATNHILLLDGVDHLAAEETTPLWIKELNRRQKEIKFIHSNLEMFKKAVQACKPKLNVIKGELRDNKTAIIVPGTLSTRMYLKQRNERLLTKIEQFAMPFSAFAHWLAAKNNYKYPQDLLTLAWKYLLQNQPHDSICGCSIDAVHRHMLARFDAADEIIQVVNRRAYEFIAKKIKKVNADSSGHETKASPIDLIVFNPLNWERNEIATAAVEFPAELQIKAFVLYDAKTNKEIPFQLLSTEKRDKIETYPKTTPKVYKVDHFKIAFPADKIPACGYAYYYAVPADEFKNYSIETDLKVTEFSMENQFLKVEINKNTGTLTLYDKSTGKIYPGLNQFVDEGDAGDEYNFSPVADDKPVKGFAPGSLKISLINCGPFLASFQVSGEIIISASLTPDRKAREQTTVSVPIKSIVSLAAYSRRVDIETEINNLAKDHRLRVLFPTNLTTNVSEAESIFDVVARPISPARNPEEYKGEKPVNTYPQKTFVSLSDGSVGLTIANRGLPEYEILQENNTIAVTLLRSVGWLSKGDLSTRPGNAGPSVPTPEAQCLGVHTFHYSIISHKGNWLTGESYLQAYQFKIPLEFYIPYSVREVEKGEEQVSFPTRMSFIEIEPKPLLISTIKKAEDRESLIIRFWNIDEKKVSATISLFTPIKSAYLVNLNEERKKQLPLSKNGKRIKLPVHGRQIVTIELVPTDTKRK